MPERTGASQSGTLSLPDSPDLDWLRKQAKRLLAELRKTNSAARLADSHFDLARSYGFSSWRALKGHIESLTIEGQLVDAAQRGDVAQLTALLDSHPENLLARDTPYQHTLLHVAAREGRMSAVELLLERGLDVNARERGDNTYPMHWAAAGGHLDVVRRLADAGGDVVGHGDDHELDVIGWATCWDGCDDAAHRAVVDFLITRGARHHIFSAIAMNLRGEVRRIVAADPSALNRRMSRNENNQTPLHAAVRMNRPEMIALLLELGADPLAVDGEGQTVAAYAGTRDVDRPVMEAVRAMTLAELASAERGRRPSRASPMDLAASLALGDWTTADRLVRDTPGLLDNGGSGTLHLMARRNDAPAVQWLLRHGVDPNARWTEWGSEATALHMAAGSGAVDAARLLLDAGADTQVRDTRFDSEPIGWAEHFGQAEMRRLLEARAAPP